MSLRLVSVQYLDSLSESLQFLNELRLGSVGKAVLGFRCVRHKPSDDLVRNLRLNEGRHGTVITITYYPLIRWKDFRVQPHFECGIPVPTMLRSQPRQGARRQCL